jgi:hypothetical protein
LLDDTATVHTPTMTLKNAALLALIGTILMTALLVWSFVFNVLNALRGLVPAVTLFSSFIYPFGCFSVAVFFYVFRRAQS